MLVLATRSGGKVRELRALCEEFGLRCETLEDLGIAEAAEEEALEVFGTFEGNARAKACYFSAKLPGRWVLAEDSGLVVDALGGAPGVRSKRWTGSNATGAALDAENNAALLRALEGAQDRSARYVCVAMLCNGERSVVGEGRAEGTIARAPSGDGGFGYDPYFRSTELGCTFAAASREEKARVSHRGRAVRRVLSALQELRHAR